MEEGKRRTAIANVFLPMGIASLPLQSPSSETSDEIFPINVISALNEEHSYLRIAALQAAWVYRE